MLTNEERLANAAKNKYYKFEFQFTRYNPQLGEYKANGSVIAKNEKEATKLAIAHCEKTIYGMNSFDFLLEKTGPLELGKDYNLEIVYKKNRYGRKTGNGSIVALPIYHY